MQEVAAARIKPKKRWTLMLCSFHRTDTHNTRDCRSLPFVANPVPRKAERRSPSIDRRQRTHETDRTCTERRHQQTPDRHRSPRQENRRASRERSRPSAREEENRSNTSRGEIIVIAGGPTGGDSNRARKAGVRQLQIHAVVAARSMQVDRKSLSGLGT